MSEERKRTDPRMKFIKQLEALRSLRRERAEGAMAEAQDGVRWATLIAEDEDVLVGQARDRYRLKQAEAEDEIRSARRTVADVQGLDALVGRARRSVEEAQNAAAMAWHRKAEADAVLEAARGAAQIAAAAHERVLEWKKSV